MVFPIKQKEGVGMKMEPPFMDQNDFISDGIYGLYSLQIIPITLNYTEQIKVVPMSSPL